MGCPVEATLICSDVLSGRHALYLAFREMERIDRLVGLEGQQSEIAEINRHAGGIPVRVSTETLALLERAVEYTRRYGGLFDVSIGPLTRLWALNDEWTEGAHQIPERARVDSLLKLVGSDRIVLSRNDTTVFLPDPGMRIDLGGIAKGYAVDRAASVLRAQGLSDFLINAGGDVYVSGRNQDGTPWHVGVKHPRRRTELIATLELTDSAVATSGDYERFFEIDGTRFHHIIDPRTGYPATASRSATVLARTAEEADVLATTLFIRGAGGDEFGSMVFEHYILVDTKGAVTCDSALFRSHSLTILD